MTGVSEFYALVVVAVLALLFAGFFEWGRSSMRREIRKYYADHGCRECDEPVRPTLVHKSGCESGWPNPSQFKLPGES